MLRGSQIEHGFAVWRLDVAAAGRVSGGEATVVRPVDAIVDPLRVSVSSGDALDEAIVSLSANLGRAVTTFAAIAVGLELGVAMVRAIRREKAV